MEVAPTAALALTPVEDVILRELPTHRTVADIAELRGVSVNTVKTHLKRIDRKLAVKGRREAVAEARAQGLLSPGAASYSQRVSRFTHPG